MNKRLNKYIVFFVLIKGFSNEYVVTDNFYKIFTHKIYRDDIKFLQKD